MKLTISTTTRTVSSAIDFRFVQNSGATAYDVILYGIAYAAGQLVKATFKRPDGVLVGPINAIWDDDGETPPVNCYVVDVPADALLVDGAGSVSIEIVSSAGASVAIVKSGFQVLPSDNIVLPSDIDTDLYNALAADISDLSADKHNVTAITGTAAEISAGIDEDTAVYSKNKTDEVLATEIGKVLDGTSPITSLDVNGDGDISGSLTIHTNLTVLGSSNLTALTITGDDIDVNGNKVINLADGTSATDAVNKGQLDLKLDKAGDTMSGALAMGGNKVTGLGNGSADGDAVNIGQLTLSLAYKQDISEKDQANGYAGLNSSGKLANSVIPALAITERFVVASEAAQLALTAQQGDVAIRTDLNKSYIHNGGTAGTMSDWTELLTPTDLVLSVNGETGAVTIDASDIATDEVGQTVQDALDIQDGLTTDHESRLDTIEATQLVVTNITGGTAETPTQSTKVPSIAKATEIADTAVQAITQINQDEALSRFSPPLIGTVTDETEVTDTAQGFHANAYTLKGLSIPQLVKNGNFVNTGNWAAGTGTLTVSNNQATLTSNSGVTSAQLYQSIPAINANVYFVSIDLESVTKEAATYFRVYFNGQFVLNTQSPTVGTITALITANTTASVEFNIRLAGTSLLNTEKFVVSNAKLINLTALGNIPGTSTAWTTLTASQVAAYLGEYDTTDEIVAKAIAGGETNKVTNPGFESDLASWTKNGTNTATADTSIKRSGAKSMKTDLVNQSGEYFQDISIANGRTIQIVAWAYVSAYTSGQPLIRKTDFGAATNVVDANVSTTTIGSWQRIEIITTVTHASGIRLRIYSANAGSTVTVYWDDVSVYDVTDYFATSGIHSFTADTIEVTDGTDTRTLDVSSIGGLASLPSGARDLFENTIQPDGERLMQITKVAHRLPLPYGQVGGQDIWQLKKVGTANTRFEMKIENFWTAYTPDMDATRCYRNTFTSGLTYIDESGVGQTLASISLGSLGLETWAEDATPTIIVEGSGYGALNTYENVAENFVVGVALNATSTALLVCISGGLDQSELDAYIASNPIQVVIPLDTYGTATNNAYTFPHTQVTFNAHCADTAGLTIYQDQDGQHFVSYKVANATADTLAELYTHLLANPITLVIPIVEAQFEHVISDYLTQYDESTFSVASSTFVKPSYWSLTYIKDLNKVIAAILAAIA